MCRNSQLREALATMRAAMRDKDTSCEDAKLIRDGMKPISREIRRNPCDTDCPDCWPEDCYGDVKVDDQDGDENV